MHPKTRTIAVRMLLGAILIAGLIYSLRANGQELALARGLVCDRPEQVSEIMQMEDRAAALKQVNDRDGDDSCIEGMFHLMKGQRVGQVKNKEGIWDIHQLAVFAQIFRQVGPAHFVVVPHDKVFIWFSAFLSQDEGA